MFKFKGIVFCSDLKIFIHSVIHGLRYKPVVSNDSQKQKPKERQLERTTRQLTNTRQR